MSEGTEPVTPHALVRCPRCGHDLRASLRDWHDGCPVEGVCAECGLHFQWGGLLAPASTWPRWLIEYCGLRSVPLAWCLTAVAALTGWPLWRRVSLEMTWRPVRLVAFVLSILLLVPALACVAGNAALGVKFWAQHRNARDFATQPFDPGLPHRSLPAGTRHSPALSAVLADSILWPLSSRGSASVVVDGRRLLLPSPRDRFFGAWNLELLEIADGRSRVVWHRSRRVASAPGVWTVTGSFTLNPPRTLTAADWISAVAPGQRVAAEALIATGVQWLAMPLFLACLPVTRRRCRVRVAHLVRATLYSTVPVIVIANLHLPGRAYLGLLLDMPRLAYPEMASLLVNVSAIALAAWWGIAVHWYLRMPHAGGIVLLGVIWAWTLSALAAPDLLLDPWVSF